MRLPPIVTRPRPSVVPSFLHILHLCSFPISIFYFFLFPLSSSIITAFRLVCDFHPLSFSLFSFFHLLSFRFRPRSIACLSSFVSPHCSPTHRRPPLRLSHPPHPPRPPLTGQVHSWNAQARFWLLRWRHSRPQDFRCCRIAIADPSERSSDPDSRF